MQRCLAGIRFHRIKGLISSRLVIFGILWRIDPFMLKLDLFGKMW